MTNKTKMKIALVCPASLPATQFGGILFLCVDIARETSSVGNDVTIYTTDLDFANNAHTFSKKLPRLEKIGNFLINRTHTWFSFKLFYVNPGMYFQLKKDKPDIIHTIGIRSFQSLIAATVSKRNKIPLVISDQGGLTTHPDIRNSSLIGRIFYKIQKPFISFIIKQATKISVPNEYEKEIFAKLTDPAKIQVIKNGINLEQFNNLKLTDFKTKYNITQDYILFVGRFARVKGIDILLNAWSKIKQKKLNLNLQLVIMGVDFGFEDEMFRMIKELGISENVIVIRKPPREDVLAAYAQCLFLVLPSRWELSPLTPLEGFAFKKPVISTTAHGIPHTIKNGENSILVEPENSSQLADAIIDLLNDEVKRIQFGNAGYRLVHDVCNSRKMSLDTLELYKTIINRQTQK